MLRIRPVLAVFGCALMLNAAPVSISNDIGDSPQDFADVVDDAPVGASFTTGSTAYQLTTVVLVLSSTTEESVRASKRSTSHFRSRHSSAPAVKARRAGRSVLSPRIPSAGTTVTLWSDNGQAFPNNGPATQLAASTTTVLDTSLSITPTSFTFQFSNYPLAANTHYWIMASSPGGNSEAEWWSTFNVSGTDVTTEFADFEGEIFQNVPPADPGDAEAYLMQVNALATSTPAPPPATPAPSSVMLVIIGLCCAGLYFKRRRLSQPS